MKYFATKYRPQTFDEVVGQEHLVSKNSSLRKMVESKNIFNMIFYGPPGCGKSTIANIIASVTNRKSIKLNAVDLSVKEIRAVIEGQENIILLIDEIHLLNKKQQQSLLEVTESGKVSLIGILSENPYFCLHNALLSRSVVFQFKPITEKHIEKRLNQVIEKLREDCPKTRVIVEDELIHTIARSTNGDIRSALNVLQIIWTKKVSEIGDPNYYTPFDNDDDVYKQEDAPSEIKLEMSDLSDLSLGSYHDRDGDNHYDTLSAFHKSLRGSDENAAIYYLARLVKAKDLQGIIRRLLCVASEDVGMANPQAIVITKACVDSALQLGFPEARIPLAGATIFLARQPKSNSVIVAIDEAMQDVELYSNCEMPSYLKDGHYEGAKNLNDAQNYKYPHDYSDHWVKQEYLPKELNKRQYYRPANNKTELGYEDAWKKIRNKNN